jgi:hypothetical protein
LLYDAVRRFALTYKIKFDRKTNVAFVTPDFFAPAFLGNLKFPISDMLANFTVIPTENPNLFIRRSEFFNQPVADYQFVKIFNEDGSETPMYKTYLSKINAGPSAFPASTGFSNATHLRDTQLFARAVRK